jgi:hypothetical protein
MVLGFNHNIQYKGELFHIQTEDSGVETPHIITLLYRGGTIISSKKTSYADIIRMDNLDKVVEELMKDQHKEILRRLKAGDFDERAFARASSPLQENTEEGESSSPPLPVAADVPSDSAAERAPKQPQSLDEIILDYLVAGDTE